MNSLEIVSVVVSILGMIIGFTWIGVVISDIKKENK